MLFVTEYSPLIALLFYSALTFALLAHKH